MIDEKVGEILKTLREVGYLENAVVIFTSDHGDAMADHGHSQKWTMYDIITRMPMIVFAPGRFPGGRKIDGLCQHMDIGPTILELAGARALGPMEAESLLPPLRGESWGGREHVFAEHGRDAILQQTEFETMVRSRDWKLVHFLDEKLRVPRAGGRPGRLSLLLQSAEEGVPREAQEREAACFLHPA